jgi:hypothetical protein
MTLSAIYRGALKKISNNKTLISVIQSEADHETLLSISASVFLFRPPFFKRLCLGPLVLLTSSSGLFLLGTMEHLPEKCKY